jgi:succinate dehydrogenase / fumarate reductase iron-sulfur subunit
MKFKIFRFNKTIKDSRYDTFELESTQGTTILNALFFIQDKFDDSLSFRYSCRGAVCGSCAMLINKAPRLACRTQVAALLESTDTVELKPYPAIGNETEPWNPRQEIIIEPLPHLRVEKDLIVNMDKFFKYYRNIEPVFKPKDDPLEKERRMEQKFVSELEQYTNCILCGACFGSCPVNGKNPEYLGPAALAKLYRFHIDPRESGDGSRLELANHKNGWWACEFHTNCKRVCPKGVPPNLAIGKARKRLKELDKIPDVEKNKKK